MRSSLIRALGLACGLVAAYAAHAVEAAEATPPGNPLGGASFALADTSLAALRGGYLPASGGLLLSFGITRSVAVDGSVVAAATWAGAANPASVSISMSGPATAAALVQNAADGRKLQTTTVIDASANSLGLMRQSNLQSSLRGALIDSLRR